MSANNYVYIRRFGKNDYRWCEVDADGPEPESRDFGPKSYTSPVAAASASRDEVGIIEYGFIYSLDCFRED